MLKQIFMASAMVVATPVLALDMPQQGKGAGGAAKTSAAGEVTPSAATPGAPKATPPVQAESASAAPAASASVPTQPVKTADGTPQTPAPRVKAIVSREFAAYDSDGSGTLDKTEFAAWMAALQAQSPTADAPTKPWTAAAFKQADADASATVTQEELAGFFIGAKVASEG